MIFISPEKPPENSWQPRVSQGHLGHLWRPRRRNPNPGEAWLLRMYLTTSNCLLELGIHSTRKGEESWEIYGPMVLPSIWGVLPGFWLIATELHWTLHVDWFDIPSSTCDHGFPADWTEVLISGALHHFVLQQQSAAHNQVRRAIWCMNLRQADDTGLRIHAPCILPST